MHVEKEDRHHVAVEGLEWRYPERGVSKTDRMVKVGMDHWYPKCRSPNPTSLLEQGSLEHTSELCSDGFCISTGEETHSLSGQPLCFLKSEMLPVFSWLCLWWRSWNISPNCFSRWDSLDVKVMSYWLEMRSNQNEGMVLPVLAGQPGDVSSQLLNISAISHLEGRCVQRCGTLLWVP